MTQSRRRWISAYTYSCNNMFASTKQWNLKKITYILHCSNCKLSLHIHPHYGYPRSWSCHLSGSSRLRLLENKSVFKILRTSSIAVIVNLISFFIFILVVVIPFLEVVIFLVVVVSVCWKNNLSGISWKCSALFLITEAAAMLVTARLCWTGQQEDSKQKDCKVELDHFYLHFYNECWMENVCMWYWYVVS